MRHDQYVYRLAVGLASGFCVDFRTAFPFLKFILRRIRGIPRVTPGECFRVIRVRGSSREMPNRLTETGLRLKQPISVKEIGKRALYDNWIINCGDGL